MKKRTKRISQNIVVSEETVCFDSSSPFNSELPPNHVINMEFFVDQNSNAKSPIQALVKQVSREVNRHKLNYAQLKYIFRSVRERCGVEVSTSKSSKLYELPTQDELSQFYTVIADPIHRLIFETLATTGLRVSELCNLEIARIDFKTNLVFVSEGKGKKDRVTVIGNRLKEKLLIYLEGRSNRYLFESNRNTHYSSRRIEQICKHYKDSAGIEKDLSPHTFRHIWNTRLAAAAPVRVLK